MFPDKAPKIRWHGATGINNMYLHNTNIYTKGILKL